VRNIISLRIISDFVKSYIPNVTAIIMYFDEILERRHRDGSTFSYLYKALEQVKIPFYKEN